MHAHTRLCFSDYSVTSALAGIPGLGGMNIGNVLSNPTFMNMVKVSLFSLVHVAYELEATQAMTTTTHVEI